MFMLDCTLRDGGYYTNWDFDRNVVDTYIEACNHLPLDYLEIGYRSEPMKEYLGEYFYCPVYVLERIREKSTKKLVIILNEKDVRKETVSALLEPCKGLIDMVRIALDPQQLTRALGLAEKIKTLGFEVGFNVMYMSTWADQKGFLSEIKGVDGLAEYFYMVDSYGGVYPQDVIKTIELVKEQTSVPLGFHGHNNLELGLINTLTALEHGATIVDTTITGMGRGAGNLKTELLLTVLHARGEKVVDFNALSKVVDPFTKMQEHYGWGTNLPYMVSGAHSLPQKQVMEWVSKRYFSLNSIIRALANQSQGMEDNQKLPELDFNNEGHYTAALIVGGGPSVSKHAQALHEFIMLNPGIVLIHASSKNAMVFKSVPNDQYFCLVGNEGHRLEDVFGGASRVKGKSILPPFPRKMGTYIPSELAERSFELKAVNFTDMFKDSHTALALEAALELGISTVYVSGYDGYGGETIGEKEQDLFRENEHLFKQVKKHTASLVSITPTKYAELIEDSVYARI
jgi:4-hydroxy 2-oxovalerate aldolase